MKEILLFIVIWILSFSAGMLVERNNPRELTYSEKRTIAIEFACHEKWKGMKGFCGNLPPADRKDEK